MTGATIRLVLFRQAPALSGDDLTEWTGYRTTSELNALPAWQELDGISGYPLSTTLAVSKRDDTWESGINNYVMFTTFPFSSLNEPAPVAAIGVEFVGTLDGTVNPLIFVTNTPVGDGTNVYPDDSLTANPDTSFPDNSNRYMFAWADPR